MITNDTNENGQMDANGIGKCIILPSSHLGSSRSMYQLYQDSMALARYYQKVDYFITMTANPHWHEIEESLLTGQTAADRPDIVARVFNLKKDALHLLCTSQIRGEVLPAPTSYYCTRTDFI